jgi:hypothetical protein
MSYLKEQQVLTVRLAYVRLLTNGTLNMQQKI